MRINIKWTKSTIRNKSKYEMKVKIHIKYKEMKIRIK